jgi:hypothetical protein
VPRADLLHAEHEDAKEGVLDLHVVGAVQALLSNREQFLLHRLLHLLEGQLGQSLLGLSQAEAHLAAALVLGVEHGQSPLDVAEKHVQVRRHEVLGGRLLHLVQVLAVHILRRERKEVLRDDCDASLFAPDFRLDRQAEEFVARSVQQVPKLRNAQLVD